MSIERLACLARQSSTNSSYGSQIQKSTSLLPSISGYVFFVSTSATISALCTLISRNRPATTHDCISNNRTSTCFKRPAPVRFANCNTDELSSYTTGGSFATPCSTRNRCIPSTSTAALPMEYSSASQLLKAYDA